MRPAKRGKVATCACGKLGDDTCSICQILMFRRKRTALRWNACRLGNWSEHWLHTACDIVGDGGSKDVISLIAQRRFDMKNDDIDVCARLVALLARMNHTETGRSIFNICKSSFEKHKSDLCIIASSYYQALSECKAEAYQTAKKAKDRNRMQMARCIADMYSIKMSI